MPTAQLKSLAKRAGKSVKRAESYWKEAKAQATKKGVEDKYAYATGIVKKRLGLESSDLIQVGVPTDLVLEADLLDVGDVKKEEGIDLVESAFAAFAIANLYKADSKNAPNFMVGIDNGSVSLKESFLEGIESLDTITENDQGKHTYFERLKELMPGCPEYILRAMAGV